LHFGHGDSKGNWHIVQLVSDSISQTHVAIAFQEFILTFIFQKKIKKILKIQNQINFLFKSIKIQSFIYFLKGFGGKF